MTKRHQFHIEKLCSLLVYILGHRPDEFGLVPDNRGFVPVKRLLQALREEPGWSHAREGLLREVLLSEKRELFESRGSLIRVKERRYILDTENPAPPPSGLVFSPIRKRAHPHVLKYGLEPRPGRLHILTSDKGMALRIGGRIDPQSVIIEIHIPAGGEDAVPVYPFGSLFLTPRIPPAAIAGPPLGREWQKELEKPKKAPQENGVPFSRSRGPEAGTFLLDPERDPDPSRRSSGGKKRRTWKEKARKLRREK